MTNERVIKETALSTEVKGKALSTEVKGFFDDQVIPHDHLVIPRVTLLQSNSERVTENGDKLGTFFNNITMENYGPLFNFIPIKFNYGAAYLTLESGLVCRSDDGITSRDGDACRQCPHGEYYKNWKDKKTPAKCGETVDVFGLDAMSLTPCVLTFKSTSYPVGTRLATTAKLNRKLMVYVIGTRLSSNEKGRFFVMDVKSSMDVSDTMAAEALRWKDVLGTRKVEVKEEIHDDTQRSF